MERFWTLTDSKRPVTGFAKVCFFFALAMLIVFLATGCASPTERLAGMCYANGGKASASFSAESGRVDCK